MAGTLDYKKKLEDFISIFGKNKEVKAGSPAYTKTAIATKLKAANVTAPKLPQFPKRTSKEVIAEASKVHAAELVKIQQTHFPATNNPDFETLTGLTHTGLLQNWIGGGIQTSCNSFAGNCGVKMGAKFFVGKFNLDVALEKEGLSRCWVPADSGKRPGFGDVFEHSDRLHQGISLGFKGETWQTVEGGAGGPTYDGVDKVAKKDKTFDPSILKGWLSMARMLGPQVPDWLGGWWVIYCGDTTYNYHFSEDFEVSQVLYNPGKADNEPVEPIDTGTYSVNFDDVTIKWSHEGGTERFKYDRYESVPALMEKMNGTTTRGEKLYGVRV